MAGSDRNAVALLGRDLLVPLDQPTESVDGDELLVCDSRQRPLTSTRSASADDAPAGLDDRHETPVFGVIH